MKRLFLLPLIAILLLAFGATWFYKNVQAPSENKDFGYFVIEKGTGASQIGRKLEEDGFIKSALAFKIYIQFSGQANRLQSGEFRLTPSFTLFQTVGSLTSGPVEIWVTIPEGLRREEVAQKFAKGLDRDSSFVAEFLDASTSDEGRLFPDTYLFPKDASASAVVSKLVRTFDSKTSDFNISSGLSFNQRVILASIIERETKTAAERPVVAGILMNRLDIGMALQVDATLQYAVGTASCKLKAATCSWWTPLVKDDLSISSPYNTYKFAGLPPAPISNPGLSSLKAAFEPEQTDYLYYMHGGDGQIHYAKTLSEHNNNVRLYLGK